MLRTETLCRCLHPYAAHSRRYAYCVACDRDRERPLLQHCLKYVPAPDLDPGPGDGEPPEPYPRRGLLSRQGWHGTSGTVVLVVGETPTRYRIRALEETRLAGNRRTLAAGEEALVPKRAITFPPAEQTRRP